MVRSRLRPKRNSGGVSGRRDAVVHDRVRPGHSIVCLQTMLLGQEQATRALRVLAALQSTEDDPERDSEPGKIIHELRRGKAALAFTDRYYDTVDATPLFLILLSEHWR